MIKKTWILRQLKQPSTWRGITWLLTIVGIGLNPEQIEAVAVAGMAVVGLIEVLINEEKSPLPPIDLQSQSEMSQFDERGFNQQSRNDRDDGYVSLSALKTAMRKPDRYPPEHDEREGWNG